MNKATEKIEDKTASAILQRFSTNELWIHFVERVCEECDLPSDKCNELKSRKCFDDWLNSCD
ncbi:MAG: hypothetical protein ACW99F_06865 [Candidatus Hodarchaeales archaeon]